MGPERRQFTDEFKTREREYPDRDAARRDLFAYIVGSGVM